MGDDEKRIKVCCPSMEEAAKEELVYPLGEGKFHFCIDYAYCGLEFVKYCPWCGKHIEEEADDGGD